MKRLLIILVGALIAWAIATTPPVLAADTANGAKIFEMNCAGCHVNGGNIVRRNKTLKLNALKRNGFDTPEAIAALVTNGKNNMSAYKDRLSQEQIQDVSAYVLEQALKDWR